MPRGPAGGLLAFLRRLPPAPDSDADLLDRFVRDRDSTAFAALVARHGPMVFASCRRVLGASADAEDAFQAVFLALARDAGRIGTRAAVPGWLHRVAVRTARKVAARRPAPESLPADVPVPAPDPAQRELLAALDDAVAELPDRLRAAVVLCALEGRTNTEAAAALGCPVGTVDSRLHAAKRKLRDRLTARGFAVPAIGAALTAISLETARAADSASRLTPSVLASVSGGPPSLAVSAILREMTVRTRFHLFAAVGFALAVAGMGFALHARAQKDEPPMPKTGTVPPSPPEVVVPPGVQKDKDKEKDYQNALVAAMHLMADAYGESEHLAALLERHPKLVNERVIRKDRGKPSIADDFTALHFAARRGNSRAVAVLIRYKADVNLDGGGWTPLHLAAQSGDLESVQLLVKAGAKVGAKTAPVPGGVPPSSDLGGKPVVLPPIPALTPLDLAKDGKHKDVIDYLSNLK